MLYCFVVLLACGDGEDVGTTEDFEFVSIWFEDEQSQFRSEIKNTMKNKGMRKYAEVMIAPLGAAQNA
jgi:hypothetical protein